MEIKICSKCLKELPLDSFYFEKTQNRHRGDCKKCVNKKNYKWKNDNPEKIKKDLIKNKEKALLYGREYRKKNKQSLKDYYEKNKKIIFDRDTERRREDPKYRMKKNLRTRIRIAIKTQNTSKCTSSSLLLGATGEEVAKYLESLWKPGMSWDNYGFGNDKWHIDHVVPYDFFDLTNLDEQKKCFHYTNLQPLWQKENLMKSNKLNYKVGG